MCFLCDYAYAAQTSVEILSFDSESELEIERERERERGRIFHDFSKRPKFTVSKFKENRTTSPRSQRITRCDQRRALILPRQRRGFYSYLPQEISLSLSGFRLIRDYPQRDPPS